MLWTRQDMVVKEIFRALTMDMSGLEIVVNEE